MNHNCREGSLKCVSRPDENLYVCEFRNSEWYDVSWVNFCPFCGEESKHYKDKDAAEDSDCYDYYEKEEAPEWVGVRE